MNRNPTHICFLRGIKINLRNKGSLPNPHVLNKIVSEVLYLMFYMSKVQCFMSILF